MTYKVQLTASARKEFLSLDKMMQRRVGTALTKLAEDPRAKAIKLTGFELYRIRIGDHRMIFSIDDAVMLVSVSQIGDRKDIYR